MADSVQHALDRMVSDLDDLRHRGIFSEVIFGTLFSFPLGRWTCVDKRVDFDFRLKTRVTQIYMDTIV